MTSPLSLFSFVRWPLLLISIGSSFIISYAHSSHHSHARASQTTAERIILKRTLLQEIENLKVKEAQTQAAAEQAHLNSEQLRLLHNRKERISTALKKTEYALEKVSSQVEQLSSGDMVLLQQQNQQILEEANLIPSTDTLSKNPEFTLLFPAPDRGPVPTSALNGTDSGQDPALALPLLYARTLTDYQRSVQLLRLRHRLHQTQNTLDVTIQKIENKQQTQEKGQIRLQKETRKAATKEEEAKKNYLLAQEQLAQVRQNTQALNAAIIQLAGKDENIRHHLYTKEKHLIQTHQRKKAQQLSETEKDFLIENSLTHGQATLPVQGTLITKWKQPTEAGPATGITYQTSPHAAVIAPCSGRLLFSGHFRSFGPIVILDCGHKERLVLAGLGSITASSQHLIKQNALIGYMPNIPGALFIQLHHGTELTDPSLFFRKNLTTHHHHHE